MFSFIATSAIATVTATMMFVLLDPRAQAFWGQRLSDFGSAIRSFISR